MPVVPAHRDRGDLCPGLLRPYPAEDGAIIRLRLPGGEAPLALLAELMDVARAGAEFLQVTSRGNLQLRGLPDPVPDDVVTAVLATGLVPSPAHERVRNISSSPLSGLWPRNTPDGPEAVADVCEIVAEVDRLVCADPELARLPSRFLFAIDDGRADVLGEPFDVAYRARDQESGEIRLAGSGPAGSGFRVAAREAATALVEVARSFQRVRDAADPAPWHIRELDEDLPGMPTEPLDPVVVSPRAEPGVVGPHAVVGLPLARITAGTLAVLEPLGDHVVLTGWRSLVIPGGAGHLTRLEAAGLATTAGSGWSRVGACTGAPACARGRADTESAARTLVDAVDRGGLRLPEPIHLVACERHCGAAGGVRHLLLDSDSAADLIARLR